MRLIALLLCGPFLLPPCASADEATDRAAIGRAIRSLNTAPPRDVVFTENGDGWATFEELRIANPRGYRIAGPAGDGASTPADRPTVTISHEPWGEAAIHLPNLAPHSGIVFVTSDVALAEGVCMFEDAGGTTHSKPLLFAMKKEGEGWKIASLRLTAPVAASQ